MDDFNFWWYIIAAVIYFLTRGKKKKPQQKSRPGTENSSPKSQPKSFEDLLREITEGRVTQEPQQETVEVQPKEEQNATTKERFKKSGEQRAFADDESRRVYEESIKMAEGADIAFEPDENFKEPRLFKKESNQATERSYAEELMDGFDADEAKKAVIYSEIFNRKY